MKKDTGISQLKVAAWSLLLGSFVVGFLYFINFKWLALGTIFGLVLMVLNWIALDKILLVAFRFSSPVFMKTVSFLLYHVRFCLIVLIMFIVIPKTNLYFGIGTFFGFLIPKIVLGSILIKNRSEEWWLNRVPNATQTCPEKPLSLLEEELISHDPFEVDPVEVEIRRFFNTKGEFKC